MRIILHESAHGVHSQCENYGHISEWKGNKSLCHPIPVLLCCSPRLRIFISCIILKQTLAADSFIKPYEHGFVLPLSTLNTLSSHK